jgi:hypothetical protein
MGGVGQRKSGSGIAKHFLKPVELLSHCQIAGATTLGGFAETLIANPLQRL